MHDPLVVAFEIHRPWPKTSRPRYTDGTLAPTHRYWPSIITVWHREPGGHDSGEVCKHHTRYQDANGDWQWKFHNAWRFHVHHWHVQIHALQDARRRLLTRCTWCGGRSRKGDAVNVSHQWDMPRGHWWQGERGLFHGDCSAISTAHHTCICDDPVLEHDNYGCCARCGRHRSFGMTDEHLARVRELNKVRAGGRRGDA